MKRYSEGPLLGHWSTSIRPVVLLRFLVEWATAEPGIERLYAKLLKTNRASLALCQKLGFVEDHDRDRRIEEVGGEPVAVLQLYVAVVR